MTLSLSFDFGLLRIALAFARHLSRKNFGVAKFSKCLGYLIEFVIEKFSIKDADCSQIESDHCARLGTRVMNREIVDEIVRIGGFPIHREF